MKKLLLLFFALIFALQSCKKDELIQPELKFPKDKIVEPNIPQKII